MARVKRGKITKKRHKKLLKLAKGFRGAKSKLYKQAKETVIHSLAHSYVGRKKKKRDIRALWIIRINAACRLNNLTYNQFIYGLKNANININRKMLADLAVSDPQAFSKLVEIAKKQIK